MSDQLSSQSGTNVDQHHHANGSDCGNLVQRQRSLTRDAPSGQQTTSALAAGDGRQITGASGTTSTAPTHCQPSALPRGSGTLSPSRVEESRLDEPTLLLHRRGQISADPSGSSLDGSSQGHGGVQPVGYTALAAGSAFPRRLVDILQDASMRRDREDSMEPGVGSRANRYFCVPAPQLSSGG